MPIKISSLDEMPTLNLTSMIDVLFLLIIFFMLGTRFIEDDRKIGLEVPRVGQHKNLAAAIEKKVVAIDRTGAVVFENKTVTLPELTQRLAAARQQNRKLGVIVRGDANAPFQLVASVLSACKEAGVADLGISVKVAAPAKLMHAVRTFTLLALAVDAQAIRYVVWTGLVALTCCLLVLARTQWGQSNPLRKCIVLSLLAHLLVGIYATTVQIVTAGPRGGEATSVVLLDGVGDAIDGPPEALASTDNPNDEPAVEAAPPEKKAPHQKPQPLEKAPDATVPATQPVIAAPQPPKPAAETSPIPAKPADAHCAGGPVAGERPAASVVASDVPAPDASPSDPSDTGSPPPAQVDASKGRASK